MQAALDVFNQEPPPADSPLVNRPEVVCTPHLGASTTEAQEGVAVEIADAVIGALKVSTPLPPPPPPAFPIHPWNTLVTCTMAVFRVAVSSLPFILVIVLDGHWESAPLLVPASTC